MKFLFAILALAVVGSQAISNDDALSQWTSFQKQFGKSYKSPIETVKRFAIFKENLEDIEAHNELFRKGEVTWDKGVNQFSDWTPKEFEAYVNKYRMPAMPESTEVFNMTDAPLKASVDWRESGAVTPVKNQGQCGSCWSFSATGALEGQAKIKLQQSLSLSEQNLVDCARDAPYYEGGCNGGLMTNAFLYVRDKGIDTEAAYPYEARNGPCRQKNSVLRAKGSVSVPASEEALLQSVSNVGPTSVGIEATAKLQSYRSGVFTDNTCTNRLNHGVLAVGYGTDNGQDYWLIKNSWGSSWGEGGYFRLIRNRNNCGIANMSSYPAL